MPAISVDNDVNLFDFIERFVVTKEDLNYVVAGLRRPMSHSGARALQQWVTFAALDEVLHLNANDFPDPRCFSDEAILWDSFGRRFEVVCYEYQTTTTRIVVVVRPAPPSDLVVWTPLDETNGTRIENLAENGPFTLTGGDFGDDSIDGPVGSRGVKLPAAMAMIQSLAKPAYANLKPISLAFWIKLGSPTVASRLLAGWGQFRIDAYSEKINITQNFSTTLGAWSHATTLPMDAWLHLAVLYDHEQTTDDPLLYINGAPAALTEDQTPVGTIQDDALASKYFGYNIPDGQVAFDDIRVYNRTLDALEIEALYLLGNP